MKKILSVLRRWFTIRRALPVLLLNATLFGLPGSGVAGEKPVLSRREVVEKALEAVNSIPEFGQFADLYADAAFVLANTSTLSNPRVVGRVMLYGRYIFEIGQNFVVAEGGEMTRVGGVDFQLQEVKRVRRERGGLKADMAETRALSAEEFRQLQEGLGEFTVLGLELVKDDPVPNIERYWQGMPRG